MVDTSTDDVCIVGAGPAGATLALVLLRAGTPVTLLEKTSSLDRPYRGEILQPGGQRILADLGVLDAARALGHHEHSRFQLVEGRRVLMDIDYRVLAAPHDHLLSIPQRHLLQTLLAACEAHDGFTYVPGARVTGLVRDTAARDGGAGTVTGVQATVRGEPRNYRARVTVAADGRFSKVRRLAGVEFDRSEDFDYDILWFTLTGQPVDDDPSVRVYRNGSGPALIYRSYPDRVQIGWILPHGGYKQLLEGGFDHARATIMAALPDYADAIAAQVRGPADVSLLDVFSGRAQRWATDGLLLIGDAAHVHSPIGAQGINLAVQDAVVAAEVIGDALVVGDASLDVLGRFEQARTDDVARVNRIQRMQSRAMLSRNPVANRMRPIGARLLKHTPVYGKILDTLAYGNRAITVPDAAAAQLPLAA